MSAQAPDDPTTSDAPGRSGRGRTLLLLAVLAGLVALAAVPTWLTTTGPSALQGEVAVTASGTSLAPEIPAAALVLLAAAGAGALVGRVGRWLVVAVVVGAGLLVVGGTIAVLADPTSAIRPAVAAQAGIGAPASDVHVTAWPWVALVVGVLVVLAGLWVARQSRGWSRSSRRHEQPAATGGAVAVDEGGIVDERAAWDALSRGDDPT